MYSSEIDARGKFGANVSCWNVVYGPILAVTTCTSSSAVNVLGPAALSSVWTGSAGVGGSGSASAGVAGPFGCSAGIKDASSTSVDPDASALGVGALALTETDTPMLTLTLTSSSAFSPSAPFVSPRISLARLLAARLSALPMRTSRTRTVAGSSPKTFCENTRKTSTRSSPWSCNSRERGESGRMNVRDNPKAVLYVPANNSTFSPFSPHSIARKLRVHSLLADAPHKPKGRCTPFLRSLHRLHQQRPLCPRQLHILQFRRRRAWRM